MAADYAALVAQAQAALAAGRPQDAEPALRAIVAANPAEHYAWGVLGRNALLRGTADEAEQCFRAALRADRKSAQYMNLLGVALAEQGRQDDALAALRRAAKARPDYAEAHYNLGKVLYKSADLRGARESFGRAAAIEPRYPGARYYLGKTLTELGDAAAAVALLAAATADEPLDEWLPIQHARALAALQRDDDALAVLTEAAARMPQSALVRRAAAVALLAVERYADGWREYRHRAVRGDRPRDVLPEPLPPDLNGCEVAVVWEQGLGDILFFARYLQPLRARGARVALYVPAALAPLLSRSRWADAVHVGDAAPAGVRSLYCGDLPYALAADRAEAALPLAPLATPLARWREALSAAGPAPYLAVAWRAGTDFTAGPEFGRNLQALSKSVPLDAFAQALREWPGTLVALQRAPRDGETEALRKLSGRPVLDATGANADLEEALAVLGAVDIIGGVSNTNVHLAASLGKPGVVIVPFPPEWRWMARGDVSPWFPSMRVLRARPGAAWRDTLAPLAGLASGIRLTTS